MIEQQAIDCAVELIRAIGQGEWSDIRWELQDGGIFLLLSVDLRHVELFEVNDQLRQMIVSGVNRLIPLPSRRRGPHWMVVFVHEAEVIESVYDWPG